MYSENTEGTWVFAGSMNMGYVKLETSHNFYTDFTPNKYYLGHVRFAVVIEVGRVLGIIFVLQFIHPFAGKAGWFPGNKIKIRQDK